MGRNRRQGVVHVLLFLAHIVGNLLALVNKDDTIIVPVCLPAAHPAPGFLDADKGPVDIVIGDESRLQAVTEKDAQIADPELVKDFCLLEVRIYLHCVHSPVHPCKFLLCHGVCLLWKNIFLIIHGSAGKSKREPGSAPEETPPDSRRSAEQICLLIVFLIDDIIRC